MNDAMTPASPALRLIEFWQLPQTIPPRLADRAKLCLLDALGLVCALNLDAMPPNSTPHADARTGSVPYKAHRARAGERGR